MFYIYFVLIAVNFVVGIQGKKSHFLLVLTSLFITLVFVGSRDVADLENYTLNFHYGVDDVMKGGQILFYTFNNFCRSIGISFDLYRLFLTIIGLSCYYYFVAKFSSTPNLVYSAYLSYLMIMDDVQIRNFVGCAFFTIALSFAIDQSRKWKIKYAFFVIVASLIHSSFWIYLIVLLIPSNLNKVNFVKNIGRIFLLFAIIAFFSRVFLSEAVLYLSFVDEEKVLGYSEHATRYGGLVYAFLHLSAILFIVYIRDGGLFKKRQNYSIMSRAEKTMHAIVLIDILCIVCIPMVIFSITFYRLIRNLYLINIVGFSVGYIATGKKWQSLAMILFYTGLFYYFDLTSQERYELILFPLFNNNIFF